MDSPAERLRRWARGETAGPWYVNVFPTNRCNLRCAICWQRREDIAHDEELSDERLLAFVDECAELGVREWTIAGGGEPLLRKHLVMAMCERICGHGMNGVLLTNGLSFGLQDAQTLSALGWYQVTFSLDGPSPEINDAIRSTGSFERATRHMREVARWRREAGQPGPRVVMHATITSANCEHLVPLVELAHELGCDGISAGELTMAGEYCEPFALSEEQLVRLPDLIRKGAQRAGELGMEELLTTLLLDRNEWTGRFDRRPTDVLHAACYEPWLEVAVHGEGQVGPCCIYWEKDAPNLHTSSLRAVWEGPFFQELRQKMLSGAYPHHCLTCPPPPGLYSRESAVRCEATAPEPDARALRPQVPASLGAWPAFLVSKAVANLRRHGLRTAVRRGREWLHNVRVRAPRS